ncbi:amidase [Shinella pollutisoli]|uniref:Indoleacetamide hydrolase n=1 Tax=Shinella pollutisoli TaxID=2250594 RepID=A0ABV7DGS5_9HYPH|nr:amidase [Shinella pollutisoli]
MNDVGALTIRELREAISARRLSAVEATRYYLDRIDAKQAALAAYTFVDHESALAQARAVDAKAARGDALGALAGVPLSIKDIIDVEAVPTTACSRSSLGTVPARDAEVVARLRAGDAIVIGKANCHEFAFGGPSFDLPFPPARNPWNPEYFPGGSSSGSGVAIAAGLCLASIGTDTAGSIRSPSAHCGVVGLKPGSGSISRRGVRPLSVTMDYVGPMARNARDCRTVYDCIAQRTGPSRTAGAGGNPAAGDFSGIRLGLATVSWALESRLHPETGAAYDRLGMLVEAGGGTIRQVRLPSLELIHAAASVAMMAEVAANHAGAVRARYGDYGTVFRTRTLAGESIGFDDYLAALSLREELHDAVLGLFDTVGFIALPVSMNPPGKLTAVDRFYFLGEPNINILANFLDLPAITLPCGLSGTGLPIGMQILGPRGSEAALFDIAEGLEQHIAFDLTPCRAARPETARMMPG